MKDLLNLKISKLSKEKERFLILIEKMVDGVGMRKPDFELNRIDQAVVEKERAVFQTLCKEIR